MHKILLSLFALNVALLAFPALASDGAQVPESSSLALFALGVLGVIIGRRGVMHARRHDRDEADKKD